ncbi:PKD domain-containing protein [Salinibacter grassmerensis]|uniref:PKD domain-containing protein n=1 Tax=Salinibacter grassmerensis TaxID=3040353 RepID=UPI0021E7EA59|nr:PKD domain-containing protein [Salinibacter grassmerensis]
MPSGRPGGLQRSLYSLLLAAVLFGLAFSPPAQAQSKRAGDTFYIKLGGGLSDYAGDNDGSLGLDQTTELREFFDTRKFTERAAFPYVLVGELGYQFSPEFGLGLGYQFGQYPFADGVPFTTTSSAPGQGGDLGQSRHTVQLLTRYMVGASGLRVSPYVDAGLNLSLGGRSPGIGHLVGIGVDVSLTDRTSLFVESRLNFTFLDDAVDGITSETRADALSALPAIGLKYTFDRPAVPPRILELNGPAEVTAGEAAAFAARVNEEEATRPLSYEWTFGDGRTATGLTPSHVYNAPGTYAVAFAARNDAGTAIDSLTVEVLPAPRPPRILALTATPSPASSGEPVQFESTVEGAKPLTLEWSFGDGRSVTGPAPTHTYGAPGEYTVRLTATNEDGTATDSIALQVERTLPAVCKTVQELNTVYFARGSSPLSSEARKKLQENAEVLRNCPNLSVRVKGFAAPDEPSPLPLSRDRAQAVADFYEDNGIAPDRVTTSGEGAVGDPGGKKGADEQNRRADSIPQRDGDL